MTFPVCNPSIEECDTGDSLLRPSTSHLVYLLLVYFSNTLHFPAAVIFTFWFFDKFGIKATENSEVYEYTYLVWAFMFGW